MIFTILLIVFLIGLPMAFCQFMLYRNRCVYDYLTWVLNESDPDIGKRLELMDKLPTYDRMMWQLWKFNWDDYLN